MRLRFTRTGSSDLPLIPEVPSYGLCRLEGYNGIGKSLAIRVLQLCAGEQPFVGEQDQALWDGFRNGIGKVRVEADELAEGSSILWEFDSCSFPEDLVGNAAEPSDDWFSTITINGNDAGLEAVKRIFEVEQIRANEGLLDTLADRVTLAAGTIRGFERVLSESGRLEALEDAIGQLSRLLDQVSPERMRLRHSDAERAAAEAGEALALVRETEKELATIRESSELARSIDRLTQDRPVLELELQQVEKEIASTRKQRERVLTDLDEVEQRVVDSAQAKDALRKATAAYKRASTRFGKAREALANALQQAGIDDPDDAGPRKATLDQELTELRRQRIEIDASPNVLALIDDVGIRLQQADADGIGGQGVAELDGRTFSVREVQGGLSERRSQLVDVPQSSATRRLDEQIASISQRLDALAPVSDLAAKVDETGKTLRSAEEKLEGLARTQDRQDEQQLESLRTERRQVDERLYEFASRRVVLTRQVEELTGVGDEETLQRELDTLLEQLGLRVDQLADASAERQSRLLDAQTQHAAAADAARNARAAATRDREELNDLLKVLTSDEGLTWLRAVPGLTVPVPEGNTLSQLDELDRLTRVVAASDQRVGDLRQDIVSSRVALEAVAEELRGVESPTRRFRDDARAFAQRQAEEWFAEPSVKKVLLDGAADVTVDLDRRVALWHDDTGLEHAVPLQGFSSGQSVFAYTEAQLLQLDRRAHSAANRLVVIDEFGAFVARNRLDDLKRTLLSWKHRHPSDQILMILPVSQDYEELARTAVGKRAAALADIVNSLKSVGYFAEDFA